ncbi:FxsA family protein [Stratiformator vulcanicus]|uniref:Phage T7 F exclusion suppressor FxsA n=1 Tax=Stratiformator vulcanicus TaxID=2527980 RepID=A0A517R1P0_9PLAN|nr:FxsA family protein [Stratiformator vulcanicus]QDT37788.1 phage T7 F exclusion suppressor FxsA [Stratiformator vulcanicus]
MFLYLFLLFTLVPILELALLIQVGTYIGPLPTVLIVLITGIAGAALAKREGLKTWARFQQEMGSGKPPAGPLADGAMILVAAALLVTPGVMTDVVGFSLLIPPVRTLLRKLFIHRLMKSMQVHVTSVNNGQVHEWSNRQAPRDPDIIDAEFERIPDERIER